MRKVSKVAHKSTVSAYQLIARDENMERRVFVVAYLLLTPEPPKSGSILDVAPVRKRLQTGDKPGDFLLPIVESRRRRYD